MSILKSIDKSEVLRYLGYKGGMLDDKLNNLIDECILKIISVASPGYIYKYFDIDDNMNILKTIFSLRGEDIKNHLAGCQKCAVMAITLGIETDNIIRALQVTDMAKAVILDSCATAAVEIVGNLICEKIAKEVIPLKITSRFSPGYGDMPLNTQQDFIKILDTQRKIGLTVTENNILIPLKSITAVIGISENNTAVQNSCEKCQMKDKCNFRKEGKICVR